MRWSDGWRPALCRYGFALGMVAAALALRAVLWPLLGAEAPLLVLLIAPVLSAFYGGIGPGLVAGAAVGFLGGVLFIEPWGWPIPAARVEWVRLGAFLAEAALFTWLVDARRRAQQESQRLAADVEDRVEERTHALATANVDLEAFARTVAHDLRAPLRNIQALAIALLEDSRETLGAEGRGYATRVVAGTEHMDQLVQDLLAYSRVARASLALERVELEAALRGALESLAEQAQARCADIVIQSDLPAVKAHPAILRQVLENLLENALKFTREGARPRIRVRTMVLNGTVRLSVRDDGIGISPEHQERIFGVFERLHGVERYPGTGIGLAIVRKGIERMHGRVGIESQLGSGSTFWFELPRA